MLVAKQPEKPKHAKMRPPSASARWLSCPNSVTVVPMYPQDESDASLKGDMAHDLLEIGIQFGVKPNTADPDIDENISAVLDFIKETRQRYGECRVYAEQEYDIPETGEHGTADVTFVTPKILHVMDYKNGYVMVDVRMNPQMLLYLCGAIAKFGERSKYYITVLQPNYNHIDGPFRTMEVTQDDLDWFRKEVAHAMSANYFAAGKHCKKTYCPHRGACATFLEWAKNNAASAWFPSEVNGMTDEQLAQALDHADILQGIRDELRKEAMRRIMNMDRDIPGFKVVKGKRSRDFAGEQSIAKVKKVCTDLGATDDDLYEKKFTTVAGIERFFKQKFKMFGNGAWKKAWDENMSDHVREFASGLTLERAHDGRPSHKRGNEFGAILSANDPNKVNKLI